MINTYGRKMVGLKKVAAEAKGLRGYYSGEYLELFYDLADGRLWTKYQVSLGQNIWTNYDNGSIVKIGDCTCKMTMQEIANMVNVRLDCLDRLNNWEVIRI